jgi:hypothetical protein
MSTNSRLQPMNNFEDEYEHVDEQLQIDTTLENNLINGRQTVRYIVKDIKAVFYKTGIFNKLGINFFRRLVAVKLIDVSSKGALICTDKNLKVDTNIVLGLKFKSGRIFKIKAVIVRKSAIHKKAKIVYKPISTLKLNFLNIYRIRILVMHKNKVQNYEYGIKFHDFNHELGNYLIETQHDLKFK